MTRGTAIPHDIPGQQTVRIFFCLHRNISTNKPGRSDQVKISSFGLISSNNNKYINYINNNIINHIINSSILLSTMVSYVESVEQVKMMTTNEDTDNC